MGADDKTSGSPASACAELRAAYHDCFNRWYAEKFAKGQWGEDCCSVEWDKYRECLAQHLDDKHLKPLLTEAGNSPDSIRIQNNSPENGSSK